MCYIWSCRVVVALQWLICTVRGTIFWGYLSLLRRGKYCYRISTLDSFNSEFLENWCHTFFLSQCKIIFICCVKNGSPSRLASPGPPSLFKTIRNDSVIFITNCMQQGQANSFFQVFFPCVALSINLSRTGLVMLKEQLKVTQ